MAPGATVRHYPWSTHARVHQDVRSPPGGAGAAGKDEGLLNLDAFTGVDAFVTAASGGRRWERESRLGS